jgi:phage gp36-like protein
MAIQLFANVDPHLMRRLRRETIFELLDPMHTGQLDEGYVQDLEESASTEISMALLTSGGVYNTFAEPFAKSLELLATDMMVARLGMRYPAIIGVDHVSMMVDVRKRLDMIRTGKMTLGVAPPDPASNHGGVVLMGAMNHTPMFSNDRSGKWGVY